MQTQSVHFFRRNILESFNGFYLPQGKASSENRNKRNVLDSFTSFYLNKDAANAAQRNKREDPSTGSDVFEPEMAKRNGLDSFTSFYLPKGVDSIMLIPFVLKS